MKRIDMKVVEVAFDSGGFKTYAYLCPFDVKVGDRVIVEAPSTGYTAVTVQEIGEISKKATKRVVCTIDDADYLAFKEKEQRRKTLLEQLEAKRKAMEEVAIFRILAESDSEAAEMLKELDSL